MFFLVASIQQQGKIIQYRELSVSFVQMEKASQRLMLEMIAQKGHIETSQWISQRVTYWWDLNGDN